MRTLPFFLVPCLLVACDDDSSEGGRAPQAERAAAPGDVAELEALVEKVNARSERNVATIQVQHILVAVTNPRSPDVTRTPAEAKQRAAELLKEIQGGADFLQLMRAHSDDPGEGIYTMTDTRRSSTVSGYPRDQMARSFGDVSYRLAVGELGVAVHDPATSPFGYHIIQRVK